MQPVAVSAAQEAIAQARRGEYYQGLSVRPVTVRIRFNLRFYARMVTKSFPKHINFLCQQLITVLHTQGLVRRQRGACSYGRIVTFLFQLSNMKLYSQKYYMG